MPWAGCGCVPRAWCGCVFCCKGSSPSFVSIRLLPPPGSCTSCFCARPKGVRCAPPGSGGGADPRCTLATAQRSRLRNSSSPPGERRLRPTGRKITTRKGDPRSPTTKMVSTPKTGLAPFPRKRCPAARLPCAGELCRKTRFSPIPRKRRLLPLGRLIDRSRRGGAIRALGAPIGCDSGNRFRALPAQTTARRAPTLRRGTL